MSTDLSKQQIKNDDNNVINSIDTSEKIDAKIAPLQYYKINGISLETIIEYFSTNKIVDNLDITRSDNCLLVIHNLILKAVIFMYPIKVIYKSMKNNNIPESSDDRVYSTLQIDDKLKQINAHQAFFYLDNNLVSYFQNKTNLISKDTIEILYSTIPYKFNYNSELLNS